MSEPFRKGQKVLIEAVVVEPKPNLEGNIQVERRCNGGLSVTYASAAAIRPMPPEPDGRAFWVRHKHNSNTWIAGHVLPRLNQGFVAMTYSYDPEWATIFPPQWRPVFEADPDWEIVPINPEPEPAADPVAEAERELVEAALALDGIVDPESCFETGKRYRRALAAVREARERKETAK